MADHAGYRDEKKFYERGKQIGTGKFSKVYLATPKQSIDSDDEDQEELAMKLIVKNDLSQLEKEFLREEIQII